MASWFVALCALFWSAWLLNLRIGPVFRFASYHGITSRPDEALTVRSPNSVAPLAHLRSDPFLTPMSRSLMIPVRALLLCLSISLAPRWFVAALAVVACSFACTRVTRWLSARETIGHQVLRDRYALRLAQDLQAGAPTQSPFWIYVRPFSITAKSRGEEAAVLERAADWKHHEMLYDQKGEQIRITYPLIEAFLDLGADPRAASDLNPEWETVVEKGLRKHGRLVALGRPGETIGAGRFRATDEEWQARFLSLAKRAAGFFVIPDGSPGTCWELEYLRSLGFRHCVFFMPPIGHHAATSWTDLQARLSSLIALPDLSLCASLFAYDQSGRAHVVPMSQTMVTTSEDKPRSFLNHRDVGSALAAILPFAGWNMEQEQKTSELVVLCARFCASLAAAEAEIPDANVAPALRSQLLEEGALEIRAGLRALGAPVHRAGGEQLFHWAFGDRRFVSVRVAMLYGESARIGWVYVEDVGKYVVFASQMFDPEFERDAFASWQNFLTKRATGSA